MKLWESWQILSRDYNWPSDAGLINYTPCSTNHLSVFYVSNHLCKHTFHFHFFLPKNQSLKEKSPRFSLAAWSSRLFLLPFESRNLHVNISNYFSFSHHVHINLSRRQKSRWRHQTTWVCCFWADGAGCPEGCGSLPFTCYTVPFAPSVYWRLNFFHLKTERTEVSRFNYSCKIYAGSA